jgi:hypothetical protein
MTRILILLVFTLFISSCSSDDESSVDSSELLTDFIEPIPQFGINSTEYISIYGEPLEHNIIVDNTPFGGDDEELVYELNYPGEISREIKFWYSFDHEEAVFRYAYILINENMQNLEFLTDFFNSRYGNYTLIPEPGPSETETRQWVVPNDMTVNLNYNFSEDSATDYFWLTYQDNSN